MKKHPSARTFLGRTSRAFTPSAAALSALALAALAGRSFSQEISVDFEGRSTPAGYSPVGIGPAGAFPTSNWNDLSTNGNPYISGSPYTYGSALHDSDTAATPVTLTITANDAWATGGAVGTPNSDLMNPMLKATPGTNGVLTLSNVASGYTYSLLVYTEKDGNTPQMSLALTGSASAEPTYYVTEQDGFNGTFLQGTNTNSGAVPTTPTNYVEWDNVAVGAGNSLTVTFTKTDAGGENGAGVSGFQLIGYNVWTGAAGDPTTGNAVWDIANASGIGANWTGTNNSYHEDEAVIFDDTAQNSFGGAVNISIQTNAGGLGGLGVHPSVIQLNNNVLEYFFTGDIIAGPSSLTQNGTGTTLLGNGVNTYSGGTTVNAGLLAVIAGTTIGGGALTVNNPNTGAGTTAQINLNSAQTVSSFSGTIAAPVSGVNAAVVNLNTPSTALTVNQSIATTFPGSIEGPGELIFSGSGSLALSGSSTYTGGTIVSGGTLLPVLPGTDTAPGALPAGYPVAVTAGGTLSLTVEDALGYAHYVAAGGSTYNSISELDINGGTVLGATGIHSTLPAIVFTDGGTLTASGPGDTGPASQSMNYILDGNVTVGYSANPAATATINAPQITLRGATTGGIGAGNVTAGSSVTFNVSRGTAATDLLVSSELQDETGGSAAAGAGLTKSGNGILALAGSSTYSGGTVINQGTVAVSGLAGGGLGTTPLGSGAVTLSNGGILALQGQTAAVQGLIANFYSDNPPNVNNANPYFANYQSLAPHFASLTPTLGGVNTTTGGKTNLDFSNDGYTGNANTPPFGQPGGDSTTANYGYTNQSNYEVTFTGYVAIPSAGAYTFATTSDDGSDLFINGDSNPVVSNNKYQGATIQTGVYTFNSPGLYPITVAYYQGGGGEGLLVQYQAPGGAMVTIPNSALFTNGSGYSSTQSYTNNVTVLDNANAIINVTNSASATMGSLSLGHATLNFTGDTGASLTFSSANLTNSGTINVSSADKTLTITKGISETSGPNSLTTIGSGTLVISAGSTYTGGTSVNGGVIQVSGMGTLSAFGTGPITFGGGSLSLTGQVPAGLTTTFLQDTSTNSTTPAYGTMNSNGNGPLLQYNSLSALNAWFSGSTSAGVPTFATLSGAGGKANFDFSNDNYGNNAPFGQPAGDSTTANFGFTSQNNYEVEFSGYIKIQTPGTYNFATTSDDGSVLYVGSTEVVSNNNFQGSTTQTGTYNFSTPGLYPITIGYYQGGGGQGLLVQYTPVGGAQQTLPNSVLTTGSYAAAQVYGNAVNVPQNASINVTNSPVATFGALTISNGSTLSVAGMAGANVTFTSTLISGGNAVFSPAAGTAITTGPISEDMPSRTLNMSGAGTVAINAAGTYTGGTVVNSGIVSLTNAAGLGTGPVTMNGGVLSIAGTAVTLSGFGGFNVNNGAALNGADTVATLTDGATNENRSAFSAGQFSIASGFSASFTYQAQIGSTSALADGAAFAIQSYAPTALGNGGGSLGLPASGVNGVNLNSDGVEFNVWSGHIVGTNATNNSTTGNNGSPAYLSTGSVNLASTDPIAVQLTYINSTQTLTETLTDTVTAATFTTSYNLDLTAPLIGAAGYVGFSAGSGGLGALQTFSNFSFTNFSTPLVVPNNISIAAGAVAGLDVPQPAPGASGTAAVSGALTLNLNSTLKVTGGATATNTAYLLNVSGATSLAGNNTVGVFNNGTGSGTATFSGLVSESVTGSSLTKTGNGTLVLNGPVSGNTFTGGITVNSGALATQAVQYGDATGSPFGTGTITLAGGKLALQGYGGAQAGLYGSYYDQAVGGNPASNNFVSIASLAAYYGPLTATVSAPSTRGGFTTFNFGQNFAELTGDSTDFPDGNTQQFAAVWTGKFNAPVSAGTSAYTFATTSDDGSVLFIDGQMVVNNNNFQAPTQMQGTITLTPGLHTVEVAYYQGTGGYAMSAQVENPNIAGYTSLTYVPQSNLSTVPGFLTAGGPNTSQVYANPIAVTADSSIDVSNSLNATVGTVSIGANTLSVTSADPSVNPYSLSTGPVTLTGNATFSVSHSSGGGAGTLIPGVISGGANGLTKSGNGVLVLANANSYSGGTTINAGTVFVTNAGGLSSGAVTMNGGILSISSLGGGVAGFSAFTANGAALNAGNTAATLTDGGNSEARSIFSNTQFSAGNGFTANFTYTATGGADGAAFVIQSISPSAVGASGGALGYGNSGNNPGNGGILNSAALEFNLYSGNGGSGTAFNVNAYTGQNTYNGGFGYSGYLSTGALNLASGDPIGVSLTYNASASTLAEVLTDSMAGTSFSKTYTGVNLASQLINDAGYIGFSGGTGGVTSTQAISNFTFNNYQPLTIANNVSVASGATAGLDVAPVPGASASAILQGTLTLNANATLNITDGTAATATNMPYNLTVSGATTIAGSSTINVANNGTALGTAVLGAVGESAAFSSLTKGGNGTLIITGAGTYSGPTIVTGGTLQIGNNGTTGTLGSGPALTDATLVFARSDTYTVANNLSGTGAVTNIGTGTLNLNGSQNYVTLNANAGTTNLNSVLGNGASTLNVNAAVNMNVGAGATQILNGLNVGSAAAPSPTLAILAHTPLMPANGNTVVVNNVLTFQGGFTAPTATIDLQNNAMVIMASTGVTLSQVEGLIASGANFSSGYFNGPGITSSNAANDPNGYTAVGYADNSQLGYTSINGTAFGYNTSGPGTGIINGANTDILVKYTYFGDTDLNGTVDVNDYNDFLGGYLGFAPATWLNGDFDYNGTVDINDYNDFLAGLAGYDANGMQGEIAGGGGRAETGPSSLSAPVAVPEPGSMGLLLLGVGSLLGLRRRKSGGT